PGRTDAAAERLSRRAAAARPRARRTGARTAGRTRKAVVMHAASLEADYRASIPSTGRTASGGGDLFAELLRRHADTPSPETRASEAPGKEMRGKKARGKEARRAEPEVRTAERRPAGEPKMSDAEAPRRKKDASADSDSDRAPATPP